MTERQLERSRSERMVAGVAGGLGEYLGVDPTLVRLVFVLLALAGGGAGVIVYGVMWLLVPEEGTGEVEWRRLAGEGSGEAQKRPVPQPPEQPSPVPQPTAAEPASLPAEPQPTRPRIASDHRSRRRGGSTVVFGGALVLLGLALVFLRFSPIDVWRLWPLAVVFVGFMILLSSLWRRD